MTQGAHDIALLSLLHRPMHGSRPGRGRHVEFLCARIAMIEVHRPVRMTLVAVGAWHRLRLLNESPNLDPFNFRSDQSGGVVFMLVIPVVLARVGSLAPLAKRRRPPVRANRELVDRQATRATRAALHAYRLHFIFPKRASDHWTSPRCTGRPLSIESSSSLPWLTQQPLSYSVAGRVRLECTSPHENPCEPTWRKPSESNRRPCGPVRLATGARAATGLVSKLYCNSSSSTSALWSRA